MISCIYKITSPQGKVYIGQTIDFRKRLKAYRNGHFKGQIKLYRSVLKYGWKFHRIEIIHECSPSFLNGLEILYIEHFNSYHTHHGLNLQSGGSNGWHSEETKQKISQSHKGKKNVRDCTN